MHRKGIKEVRVKYKNGLTFLICRFSDAHLILHSQKIFAKKDKEIYWPYYHSEAHMGGNVVITSYEYLTGRTFLIIT